MNILHRSPTRRRTIANEETEDRINSIVEALKIVLPADTLPMARKIYRAVRRIAEDAGREVPSISSVFSLIMAQPVPLTAFLDAQAEGVLAGLTGSNRSVLLACCRLPHAERHDVGILMKAYWTCQK